MTVDLWLQSIVGGVSLGFIYALMAMGLILMFGMMHILNFAHGAVYMLGAFAIFYLFVQGNLNYAIALPLAMLLVGLLGVLVERVVYRPVSVDLYASLVAFMGLAILLEALASLVFGVNVQAVKLPFAAGTAQLGSIVVAKDRIFLMLVSVPLLLLLMAFLYRTRWGAGMRALEQDREAAALVGVNINRTNAMAFAVGFALAAAAGALIAPLFYVQFTMGEPAMLKAFIIIMLGGMGSYRGALVGALLLGLLDSVAGMLFGFEVAFLIAYTMVIVVLWVKPAGLFGRA